MGWLWSTPDANGSIESKESITPGQSTVESTSFSSTTSIPQKPLSRDELAEQELQAFLRDLEATSQPTNTKYIRLPRQQPSSSSPPSRAKPSIHNNDPLSEQLLPKSMSCRDAFDSAFYCNSLGGQFNNLYRYGTVRACSENWNDFWFCMRTRSYSSKEKEEAIRQRYRDKEQRKYRKDENEEREAGGMGGSSSEDVWRTREKKVNWGDTFNMPFPGMGGDDEDWNKKERLRRAGQVNGSMSS